MKNNMYSVTVAISAYNEEDNIANFLKSVLMQEQVGFSLEKILIISDGSTDKTCQIIKSFKSKKICLIEGRHRLGKSSRLNTIYNHLESDFLVQSDADVQFSNKFVIRDLVKAFRNDTEIMMCAGKPLPLPGITFTEKSENAMWDVFSSLHKEINNGDIVFTADGRILAYRKKLAKQLKIPVDMFANDMYSYYFCKKLGYKYLYVNSAIVYFRSPSTLRDKVRQTKRAASAPVRMSRYFPEELIELESHIPLEVNIKSKAQQFVNDPVKSIYIYAIQKYCEYNAKNNEQKLNSKWAIAKTTKKLV